MKKILSFLCLLAPVFGYGQWAAEAPLPAVTDSAFYSIPLPPSITGLVENDFKNLRIIDEAGREVPYLMWLEMEKTTEPQFIEYILQKSQRKGCCTILTWANNDKDNLDKIYLEVKQAETIKNATMVGSDDGETWYALKDSFTLGGASNSGSTTRMDVVDFALSNYALYRIVINDSTSAPLNVVKAGYYKITANYGSYVEVPIESMKSADSVKDRSTWLTIRFDTTHSVDKIDFEIAGPSFYKREATLFEKEAYDTKKGKVEYLSPIYRFDIISTHRASLATPRRKEELYVQIMNENNQPLQVKSLKAWQRRRYVKSWLEPGHTYKIAIGGDSLKHPVYDIGFFSDRVSAELRELQPGEVKLLIKPVVASATPTYFTNRNIVWVAIILVVAVLGTMSVRMIREKEDRGYNR
jgi:hypothetical protein